MRPLAAVRGLELRAEVADDVPAVCADGPRIEQVLANLLGNAIKFTPRGGTIVVRAARSADDVCFAVVDTGPGIAKENLAHVFDRFWQAERTDRLGTGLGLYIVKGIVETHGGTVWAESEVGQGSSFFFTLPSALGGPRRLSGAALPDLVPAPIA